MLNGKRLFGSNGFLGIIDAERKCDGFISLSNLRSIRKNIPNNDMADKWMCFCDKTSKITGRLTRRKYKIEFALNSRKSRDGSENVFCLEIEFMERVKVKLKADECCFWPLTM